MQPTPLFASHIQQIVRQDELDRARRIDDAWVAYYGKSPDVLTVKPGQADDNVPVNMPRIIVDKGASYLFGDLITLKLDEHADPAAQVWLDACWASNHMMTFLHNVALNGGVTGQAFVKIEPAEPGEDFPSLINPDGGQFEVVWSPHNLRKVVKYIQRYNDIDEVTGKPRNYRQTTQRQGAAWVIIDEESDPDSSAWHTTATTLWNHPYPPILDCQNLPLPNEYWGMSDIEKDIIRLNRALMFVRSDLQRIIRWHAHPKTVASGVGPGGEIDVDVDGLIQLPSPEAKLYNLEMQSDLAGARGHAEDVASDIHELSRIPAIATGTLDSIGPLSGVALAILYQPLIEKTKTKRNLYGDLIVELCRRLLDLNGYGPKNVVTITWPKLLPVDPLQERQADLLEDQMGVVSKQTIAERLGLDWETEKKRMDEEDADAAKKAQALLPPGGSGQGAVPNPSQTLPADPTLNARASNGMKPQGSD